MQKISMNCLLLNWGGGGGYLNFLLRGVIWHLFVGRTKFKIPYEIKPPLVSYLRRALTLKPRIRNLIKYNAYYDLLLSYRLRDFLM